jgi:hypothetical protein
VIDWEWLKLTAKLAAVWIIAAVLFGILAGSLIRAGSDEPDREGDRDDA